MRSYLILFNLLISCSLAAQFTGPDLQLHVDSGLPGLDNRSMGVLGSVEAGYRYRLSDRFVGRLAAGLQKERYRATDEGVEMNYVNSCFFPFIIDFAGPDFFAKKYYIQPLTAYVAPSIEVQRERLTLSFSLQPGIVLTDRIAVQAAWKNPRGAGQESALSDPFRLDEVVAPEGREFTKLQISYASRFRLDAGVGMAVAVTKNISAGLRLRVPILKNTLHDNLIASTTDSPSDPNFCEGVYARSETATARPTIGVTLEYAFSDR